MRVVLHDYAGHPFQARLAVALSRSPDVEVIFQYCPDHLGGKGNVDGYNANLRVETVSLGRPLNRYSAIDRLRHEVAYGWKASRGISQHRPDIVIFSNVPLLAHFVIAVVLFSQPKIFWHQDVYSSAISREARKRFGWKGSLIGVVAQVVEAFVAHSSRRTVAISDSFRSAYRLWHLPERKFIIRPNWAPIDELPLSPRRNNWAISHGLENRKVMLYAGTLGLKHDPSVLYDLAKHFETHEPEACVVVVSEGIGRQWLEEACRHAPAPNLKLIDIQPYELLPEVLASGDLLLLLLDSDASEFSVPSKVYSYMCAGRPTLAMLPSSNPAALTLISAQAGRVVGSVAELCKEAEVLMNSTKEREALGHNARLYAEQHFDLERVTCDWVGIIAEALALTHLPRAKRRGK